MPRWAEELISMIKLTVQTKWESGSILVIVSFVFLLSRGFNFGYVVITLSLQIIVTVPSVHSHAILSKSSSILLSISSVSEYTPHNAFSIWASQFNLTLTVLVERYIFSKSQKILIFLEDCALYHILHWVSVFIFCLHSPFILTPHSRSHVGHG